MYSNNKWVKFKNKQMSESNNIWQKTCGERLAESEFSFQKALEGLLETDSCQFKTSWVT